MRVWSVWAVSARNRRRSHCRTLRVISQKRSCGAVSDPYSFRLERDVGKGFQGEIPFHSEQNSIGNEQKHARIDRWGAR